MLENVRGMGWTVVLSVCILTPHAPGVCQTANRDSVRSTMSGVFSAAQAARGRDVYLGDCRGCHSAPEHTPAFKQQWAGRKLWDLFAWISDNMPKNSEGSLSPTEYADVLAFTLQALGMPAGTEEMPPDSATLVKIRFDTLSHSGTKEKKP